MRRKLTNNNINEKKKINYLSVISHNILEHRQTLKNPGEFYSGLFANIIEKQKNAERKSKEISKNFKGLDLNDKISHKNKSDNNIESNFYEKKNNYTLRRNTTEIIE